VSHSIPVEVELPPSSERRPARVRRSLSLADCQRFLPLVRRTAMRVARRGPSSVSVQDLVGWGWVGLIEAYGRAEGLTPEETDAFLWFRVEGAMLDHLRALDPVKRSAQRSSRRVTRAVEVLTRLLCRAPNEEEVARELGVSLEASRVIVSSAAGACAARQRRLGSEELEALCGDGPLPDEVFEERAKGACLAAALEGLPPRLRQIITLSYEQELTLREIGELLGVSESRVCQLRGEAMERLREAMSRG
jgi:RNA polymerase sigma factor FliA